jgi:cell division septation protein DedD
MTVKNRRLFELRLGKLGLVLFGCGMSLLMFTCFLMGLMVGKNMDAYPERYATGIPEMIRDRWLSAFARDDKAALLAAERKKSDDLENDKGEFGLTFYRTLGGEKEGTSDNSTADVRGKIKETSPDKAIPRANPTGTAAPSLTSVEGVSNKTGQRPQTGEDNPKKQIPEALLAARESGGQEPSVSPTPKSKTDGEAPSGKGRFEIQAAAYREKRQAEQMVKKIMALGFSPYTVAKQIPEKGLWHRVIVGGFENREKAKEAAAQITDKVGGLRCVIRASVDNEN